MGNRDYGQGDFTKDDEVQVYDSTADGNVDSTGIDTSATPMALRRNGSLGIRLHIVDKAAAAAPVTLTATLYLCGAATFSTDASGQETVESSTGNITKKTRTFTLANYSDGDKIWAMDLEITTARWAYLALVLDAGEADIDVYMTAGAA